MGIAKRRKSRTKWNSSAATKEITVQQFSTCQMVGRAGLETILIATSAQMEFIFSYDRTASFLATYGSPEAPKVAQDLDSKVEALLAALLGPRKEALRRPQAISPSMALTRSQTNCTNCLSGR